MKYNQIKRRQKEIIATHIEATRQIIPKVLTNFELRVAIYTFYLAIGKNFVPWLATVHNNCASGWAKRCCKENLLCELTEDHWGLFGGFVQGFNPGVKVKRLARLRLEKCAPIMEQIHRTISHSAEQGMLLVAALEAVSFLNMGWLQEASLQLELRDRRYVTVHLEQDEEHASIFSVGLDCELSLHQEKSGGILDSPVTEILLQLQKTVFGCQ